MKTLRDTIEYNPNIQYSACPSSVRCRDMELAGLSQLVLPRAAFPNQPTTTTTAFPPAPTNVRMNMCEDHRPTTTTAAAVAAIRRRTSLPILQLLFATLSLQT